MSTLYVEGALAIAGTVLVLRSAPAVIALRWVIRRLRATDAKGMSSAARLGLGLATLAAIAWESAHLGSPLLPFVALLLTLLALLDRAWRWLPPEWSLLLGLAGFWSASLDERIGAAILGGILPAAGLWLLRGILWRWVGEEPLGLGDIWLIAAIGVWTGPLVAALILGMASLFGLSEILVQRLGKTGRNEQAPERAVAFGTHICTVFAIAALAMR